MGSLTVATLLWDANGSSKSFSRAYDETWVEKLYRGVARNLTLPFRFVCFTDRERVFGEPIEQVRIADPEPSYATCIEPYRLGQPMILMGLDTVIVGNIDHLAGYCFVSDRVALPRDPYRRQIACNGVALVPAGQEVIGLTHSGENDMDWVRSFPHDFIDDIWPGHVVSYKVVAKVCGIDEARIVYFHGEEKPHQISEPWLADHWA